MKIVHTYHSYYPVLGGLEKVVQELAEEQAKRGHEVHVITSYSSAKDSPAEEELNNVYVHRVKALRLYYPDLTIPRDFNESLLKGADVVHAHSQNSLFNIIIVKKAKSLRAKIVTYFLGVDYLRKHSNPIIRLLGYQYQKAITKRFVGLVDLAIVTNDYERSVLRERYGLESVVLPHGVSEQYLKTPNMENYFRSKYGVQGRVIAYVGRIHPTKGLDLLIKAFADVAKKEPDVILVIAGKGDARYLKKCMRLVRALGLEDRVKYLGYVSEEDKIGLIDSSEFVVIPSRHAGESYPLIIDEVKARRKPLVVTNYGVLPHKVVNLVEGIVVDADVHSLTRGLCYALSNRFSFRVLSRPLTWKEVAGRLLNLYQSITG
ncbi:MAG: glycosyltransferase family 4 protein [Candidatus Bathyarchaeia archaeon]